MVALKTIKAKVIAPTKRKAEILEKEFQAFQNILHGQQAEIYSKTRYQALRLLKRIKTLKDRQYPLILHRASIRLERRDAKIAQYWFRFPCHGVRGGIWLAIKPHCEIPEGCSLRETKLIKRNNAWFLYIIIKKEVPEPVINPDRILAVDLGERYLATVCGSNGIRPQFLGKEARGIRRHYAWLRRRLGELKLMRIIKKVGNTEKRKINTICHQISRKIVDLAKETGSTIVLGDLKGIRQRARGRRMNRIVSSMPYFKLTQFIKYKAAWDSVPVLIVSEKDTSKTCHRCGAIGTRPYQGLFLCPACGLRYSADLNGAKNILKRAREYISRAGAAFSQPLTRALAGNP
jgi:putative transposase